MTLPCSASERPGCNRCVHYWITHDIRFPYGCRALDFKSRRRPCLDVLESSGRECFYFRPRPLSPPAGLR